jgi:GntR family transcriptional regulator/MocR family aminotransferase
LLSAAVEERHLSDRFAPVLDQLALAELIDSGGFDSHVRRMRLRYRRRRDRLIATLRQAAPQLLPAGIAAGLHIVLELPDGLSEEGILRTAEERSIGLYGLESFRHGELHTAQALVIGYGAPPEHNFEATLTALASLLADSLANDPSRRGVVRELRA